MFDIFVDFVRVEQSRVSKRRGGESRGEARQSRAEQRGGKAEHSRAEGRQGRAGQIIAKQSRAEEWFR